MQLYTKTEVKQFLLEMAKRCREDMELPLNLYLENVSKNIDEITYVHPLEDDIPPTSQYFPTNINNMGQLKLEENIQASELIAKWNKNPSLYGVYDIIGGLEYLGTKEALDLRDYIIDSEEYDVKNILQLVNNLKLK